MPLPPSYSPYRFHAPQQERRHPWLSLLLDAYALIDASVADAVTKAQEPLACKAGCMECCIQPIPLLPLEVLGLVCFLREMDKGQAARHVLALPPENSACPFLCSGNCLVYPLRPITCRRFLVCGIPCAPGEDPVATRPHHMLHPDKKMLAAALAVTAPYYKEQGLLHKERPSPQEFLRLTVTAQTVPWATYARGGVTLPDTAPNIPLSTITP